MKKCRKCKEQKPVELFYKAPRSLDGLQSYCKKCSHEKTVESKLKYNDAWYMEDGYGTEWEHFNAALECYAEIFDMPRLTRYKVSGSLKNSDLEPKP